MYNSPNDHKTNVFLSSFFPFFLSGRGGGWHQVLPGLLGNAAVSLSGRQSCRCPSYLFITDIINVYKRLLIALFTNDLWDL